MAKMTVQEILDHCKKFSRIAYKPKKHVETFYDKAKQRGWEVDDSLYEKEVKIIALIEKVGFKKEAGVNVWWFYHEHEDITYKVSISTWFNDYYDTAFGQFDYYKYEGKVRQHTTRVGEVWFEDGQWKSMTPFGVYTGD